MFLFTTLPETAASPARSTPHAAALRTASDRSGVPFDYLLATAKRESGLKADAKAPTSSASGLFQFIEQTWLGLVREEGAAHGLGAAAAAITPTASGRYDVSGAGAKAEILALRNNPDIAAQMAGALTRRNGAMLNAALGREPTQGELYIAHFLGAAGAAKMIRAAAATPDAPAPALFGDAARANRAIFYERTGAPRSLAAVVQRLSSDFSAAAAPAAPLAPAAPQVAAAPLAFTGFHSLFASPAGDAAPAGAPLDLTAFRRQRS